MTTIPTTTTTQQTTTTPKGKISVALARYNSERSGRPDYRGLNMHHTYCEKAQWRSAGAGRQGG